MPSLAQDLRRLLEKTVVAARNAAEAGAAAALTAAGIGDAKPPAHLDAAGRLLRERLRAHGRQLGDVRSPDGTQTVAHLIQECAYEHWHRMLFARFLAENDLLRHPEHDVAMSLDEITDLAREENTDPWELASRYAQRMLPQIFRPDDPVLQVRLPGETRNRLVALLKELPRDCFLADDALGWVYQFWQTQRKEEVNKSGVKIGAAELSPVTQLFTEDYMVDFLLDNTLGAWWAGKLLTAIKGSAPNTPAGAGPAPAPGLAKADTAPPAAEPAAGAMPSGVPPEPPNPNELGTSVAAQAISLVTEQDMRKLAALPGVEWKYLRFVKVAGASSSGKNAPDQDGPATPRNPELEAPATSWAPAAGVFGGWPRVARELKCLDPCMGSGHFVVAMFGRLVALRMAEDGLEEKDAVAAVIRDNLFGLEIDPRCTQLAAFNLALAAWRRVGYCSLPPMNLACSGLGIYAKREDWLALAPDDKGTGVPGPRNAAQFLSRGSAPTTLAGAVPAPAPGYANAAAPAAEPAAAAPLSGVPPEPQHGPECAVTVCKTLPPGVTPEKDGLVASRYQITSSPKYIMGLLYDLFSKAPVLGSLIDPRAAGEGGLFAEVFHGLQPLLEKALAQETGNEESHEIAVTARGLAAAAEVLAKQFTLTATNVPYLSRSKHSDDLKVFGEHFAEDAKTDLATLFLRRALDFCSSGGTSALVTPHNWLFLGSYKRLRERLLKNTTVEWLAPLGIKAFQTPMWDFSVLLIAITNEKPATDHIISGIDVSEEKGLTEKSAALQARPIVNVVQNRQEKNVDARITLSPTSGDSLLADYVECHQGLATGDLPRFGVDFWEVARCGSDWVLWQGTVEKTVPYGGRSRSLLWEEGRGQLHAFNEAHKAVRKNTHLRGSHVRDKRGVLITQMAGLPATLYTGEHYDDNTTVLLPRMEKHLPAVWAFCASEDYPVAVRAHDASLKVPANTLAKVPFDLAHWQQVAAEKYPDGLPKPHSDDPTQWLFNGHPKGAEQPLQVAVARLLGYRWPRQIGSRFPDCPALGPDGLEAFADADGIVPLTSLRGEEPAAERLRKLLAVALGAAWKSNTELELIRATGATAPTLGDWLRDDFFAQHCAIFHQRPFVWHIWDGRKDGFHALVNYHKLAAPDGGGKRALEALTYVYLGDWLTRQKDAIARNEPGAEARLAAAQELQAELKKILAGEPPYDLFIRWKPLAQQPIGWDPDINDGVRLNIRPFMQATISGGKRGAGLLRAKPNIKWDKDRGKEPERPRAEFPWFWGYDGESPQLDFPGTPTFDGNRWNDCHYTTDAKQKARCRFSDEQTKSHTGEEP